MKKVFPFLLALWLAASLPAATTYYVATGGNDANPGTSGSPFLTVQHAESVVVAGDTIKLGSGLFNEAIQFFDNAGTSGNPITLDGQGLATVAAIDLDNPWIQVVNLSLRGRGVNVGQIYFAQTASHCLVSNCNFSNNRSNTISPIIKWGGPASAPFGAAGSFNKIVNNTFTNIAAEMVLRVFGDTNEIAGNTFIFCDETDVQQIFGRANWVHNNRVWNFFASGANPNHADFFQTFPAADIYGSINHLVEKNFIFGMGGLTQLGNITDDGNAGLVQNITFRNNVCIGVSAKMSASAPGMKFHHNVFYRCSTNAENGGPLLIFFDAGSIGKANNSESIGNVFLECGAPGDTNNLAGGTYFSTTLTNVTADYDYIGKTVNGLPYQPVATWPIPVGSPGADETFFGEVHGKNGGNPFFISEQAGDFRLRSNSPLIDAGVTISGLTDDYAGTARPQGSAPDIGAFEFTAGPIVDCEYGPRAIKAFAVVTPIDITIVWPTNVNRTNITIGRRIWTNAPSQSQPFTNIFTQNNTNTAKLAGSYLDAAATASGVLYEYQIATKIGDYTCNDNTTVGFQDFQYINAGRDLPLRDTHGKLILLVESGLASPLSSELTRLTDDLTGEGYTVIRHDVAAVDVTAGTTWTNAVWNTKQTILSDYNAAPSSPWTILIIGHVPIPYSGDYSPGSHVENVGAQPCDWFYAVMDNTLWTDASVNDSTATDAAFFHNVPGDGKFDQSEIPGPPQARIGRLDFRNLPAFGKTEVQLMKQYLDRNHDWRTRVFTVRDRGVVYTTGRPAESVNLFVSTLGTATAYEAAPWLSVAGTTNNSYLFAASAGAGGYDHDNQIGTIDNFAATNLYAVFATFFGSYYGTWDSAMRSNVFTWAALASAGYTVASYYHDNMVQIDSSAIDFPIGEELFLTAANKFQAVDVRYSNYARNGSLTIEQLKNYQTLLGDPTLRVHVVPPPLSVVAAVAGADKVVTWVEPDDFNIAGAHVYRANLADPNNFTRLTSVPATGGTYTDSGAGSGSYRYMARTVKRQYSGSGNFDSASQGIFVTSTAGGGGGGGSSPKVSVTGKVAVAGRVILQ